MSYCAYGSGDFILSGHHGFDTLRDLDEKDGFEVSLYAYDENTDETSFTLYYDGNYHSDDVDDFFEYLCENYKVLNGIIEFTGEDSTAWRFIYDKTGNCFTEQNGRVSYLDIDAERLLAIFQSYVNNDLNTADPDYVREVLQDVCGMNKNELLATGFDYLFDGEEAEQ